MIPVATVEFNKSLNKTSLDHNAIQTYHYFSAAYFSKRFSVLLLIFSAESIVSYRSAYAL
jgi:ABC-type metal ion transport system substrate-binding protein